MKKEVLAKFEICFWCGGKYIDGWHFSIFQYRKYTVIERYFRNSKCKPKGRRWNFENTLLALSLLIRSPKFYSFLRLMLPLP